MPGMERRMERRKEWKAKRRETEKVKRATAIHPNAKREANRVTSAGLAIDSSRM